MAWKNKGMGKNKGKKSKARMASAGVVKAPQKAPKKVGYVNVRALANAVSKLNCEKKEYGVYAQNVTVGQIYVASAGSTVQSGHYLSSLITPTPSNGTSDITRIGDEVTITGIRNVFQFIQQSNATIPSKIKMMLFSPRMGASGLTVSIDKLLNPNPIIYNSNGSLYPLVYDTICTRNQDYLKDFKILRQKTFNLQGDMASTTQRMAKTINFGLKFKYPWKLRFDSSGAISSGQIYLLILVENGNNTANTPGASNGAVTTDTLTGYTCNYYSKSYYIDP